MTIHGIARFTEVAHGNVSPSFPGFTFASSSLPCLILADVAAAFGIGLR